MKKGLFLIVSMLLVFSGCAKPNTSGTQDSSSPAPQTGQQASSDGSGAAPGSSQESAANPSSDSAAETPEAGAGGTAEDGENSGEDESGQPEDNEVLGGNGEATFDENTFYRDLAEKDKDTGDTLMLLINHPNEAAVSAVQVTDEFNLAANDQVLMIPKYEHSTIRVWTLKSVIDPETDSPVQERDELVYECLDSTVKTVLFTSIPRIEDAPLYCVVVDTPLGTAEYSFTYMADVPGMEYLEMTAAG